MVRHVQAVVRPPPTRHRTECRSEEGIGCGLKFPRKSIVGLCGQCNLIESLYLNGGDSDDDEDMARQDNLIRKVRLKKSSSGPLLCFSSRYCVPGRAMQVLWTSQLLWRPLEC
ncbi:hypothetical protein E1B28_000389 [Marasmius oreades]|uniref:Uncharacterized protein n=1 Tax=Marasmius oreades TaxID=181124 RepID=A0A9P7V1C6_9AGAR|nr:uncharacterized protein E1B28_000389 [Marasmius oreades]KAG7098437.1 hypothetical protein E1B28_000389 [Marasmius oreades]